jgi:hypothetical protein
LPGNLLTIRCSCPLARSDLSHFYPNFFLACIFAFLPNSISRDLTRRARHSCDSRFAHSIHYFYVEILVSTNNGHHQVPSYVIRCCTYLANIVFIVVVVVKTINNIKCKLYSTFCHSKKGKSKAVPLHAMEALVGRGGIAPTHSRPRH